MNKRVQAKSTKKKMIIHNQTEIGGTHSQFHTHYQKAEESGKLEHRKLSEQHNSAMAQLSCFIDQGEGFIS